MILITDAMVEAAAEAFANHEFRINGPAMVPFCSCGWAATKCYGVTEYDQHVARSVLEVVAPLIAVKALEVARGQIEAERPQVTLEWSPNDDSPPCVDFTCACGYWRHLCNGPDWIEVGRGGSAPGVRCRECGVSWSLYWVSLMGRL